MNKEKTCHCGENIPLVPPAAKHSPFEGGFRGMLCFVIFNLLFIFLSSVPAHAWTQTDWSGGDSTFFWSSTDTTRYDTGINVDGNNPAGAVSMTDTGLLGYWHFNEGTGSTAYDQTSNNNDGTITGAIWGTTAQDSAVWGYGLSFNGSSDYVDCGNTAGNFGTGAFTIEMWIKTGTELDGDGYVPGSFYQKREADQEQIYFGLSASRPYFNYNAGDATDYAYRVSSTTLQLNTWYHLAVVVDRQSPYFPTIYLNGVNDGSASTGSNGSPGTANMSNTGPLWIGKSLYSGTTKYFDGAMDEVRIYSRALSADEIATHANLSAEKRGLSGYWKFDDTGYVDADGISATDSTLSDATTNANHGTISGCMWGWEISNQDSAVWKGGLSFDGTDDYVTIGDIGNIKTIEYWIKADSDIEYVLDLDGGGYYIMHNSYPMNFTNTTVYVDGSVVETLGSELLTNGGFDDDSGWTDNAPWTIGSGIASVDGSQPGDVALYQTSVVSVDKPYFCSFDWTRTAGTLYFKTHDGSYNTHKTISAGSSGTTTGTFTTTGTSNGSIYLVGNVDFIGTVDNAVVKEIITNVPANEWHHVAVVVADTGIDASSVTLGKESSNYFTGAMDEVRIYSRALSADEIAAHADTSIIDSLEDDAYDLGDNAPRGVLLSSTFDADSEVVWKTIEWNAPSTEDNPYERGDSRLRKDEGGLVALWHFDEGEDLASGTSANDSTVYDESTNSNTGIVHGCLWGKASEDSAVFQSALSFDGVDDFVEVPDSTSLNITSAITVEAWVKPNSLGTYGAIAGKFKNSTDNQAYLLYKTDADKVRFLLSPQGNGTNRLYFDSDTSLTLDTWCHVVGVLDNANNMAYIYLNGREDKSAVYNYDIFDSDIPLLVGRDGDGTFFDGLIDEVAIYSYAKTTEEIWQDARGTQMRLRTQTTSSILDGTGADSAVGLWHFDNLDRDNPSSTVAYDSSVYGNDGTITDAKWSQYGVFEKCLSFDGTGDYVATPVTSVTNFVKTDAFTIEAWVYNSSVPADWKSNTVASNTLHTDSYKGWYVGYTEDRLYTGKIAYHDGTWHSLSVDTANTYEANQWHHIAYVNTGVAGEQKFYVNGIEDSGTRIDNTDAFTYSGNQAVYIGRRGTCTDSYHDGLIDEVGIYNYARSASQIKMDARGWSPWSPYYKNADIDDIVLFSDDFNDGVIVNDWTVEAGGGAWHIDNIADDTGYLQISGLSSLATITADNTNWYDEQVEVKVKIKAAAGKAGIIYRKGSGTNYGYVAYLEQGSGVKAYSMNASGPDVSKGSSSMTINTNTWYTLKVTSDGATDRVYVNDAEKISFSNTSTYKAKAGLYAEDETAVFDDFKVFPIDRYCRYEATLTDNMCNDTTPYLYWVRLTYDDVTSDDSIWSRVWQDRYGTHGSSNTWCPKDEGGTGLPLNYAEIDSADTTWCYNLENYDSGGDNTDVPDGKIRVFVETLKTTSYLNLRLGYRKTSALSAHSGEWPEDIDDYEWSDWMNFGPDAGDWALEYTEPDPGDTVVWQCTLDATQMTNNFSTEAGYVLQSRAVSTSEGTEPDPTNFQPDSTTKDRQDTSIIYVMRDITPPGSENTTGGVDGTVSASGYTSTVCANSGTNTLWTSVGAKGILSYPESTTRTSYRDNSEYVWFNIDSSADDSGIRVKVEEKNPDSNRETDCSGLDEDDTSIRYRYSVDGGTNWKGLDTGDATSDVATWAKADTNIWTDRYIVAQDNLTGKDADSDPGTGAGDYRYSIASLDPGSADYATKGENVLIQFAQKDKAGNWGYSHRAATYYATQTSGCSTTNKGYFINVDLLRPVSNITKGPREANYSTSAGFEFKDNSENDSPLLCAFSTQLELNDNTDKTAGTYGVVTGYDWTSYQPWSPTSDEGSSTFTDIDASTYWYRCRIKTKDEALNESQDYDTYYFQCLAPVPNTIIYSGPAGIITDDNGSYDAVFKFRGEGGNVTPYEFAYSIDGSDWDDLTAATSKTINSLGYGNHVFRVKARNGGTAMDSAGEDQTPACVTFTIADPAAPPAVAPPGDPVKYWREESE